MTGVGRYPPKEKGSCKHGSSRGEAIHECQTSSNSLTFWPWPHTFAPTWRDGSSVGLGGRCQSGNKTEKLRMPASLRAGLEFWLWHGNRHFWLINWEWLCDLHCQTFCYLLRYQKSHEETNFYSRMGIELPALNKVQREHRRHIHKSHFLHTSWHLPLGLSSPFSHLQVTVPLISGTVLYPPDSESVSCHLF